MKQLVLTSLPDEEVSRLWNELLSEGPYASHYVTPNYFTDPYVRGERFAVLAFDDSGKAAAVLTGICDIGKVLSGLFSRPQLVFRTGVDRESATSCLLAGVEELTGGRKSLIELYSWDTLPGLTRYKMRESGEDTSAVVLDLSRGADLLFADFSQTRRNELRKAERAGLVEVKELESEAELMELYRIHCEWNMRKGHEPDKIEQLRAAAEQRENRRIFIATVNGKVVAGSFYRFCPGGLVEYAANFSIPEFQKLRPNDLIGWHAIKWACDSGFSHFSMGGSHLFLRRFGGPVVRTFRYRCDQRPFRFDDLRESVRDLGVQAFGRLPIKVRKSVRRFFAS